MAEPWVRWFNDDNTVEETVWDIGTVDAGDPSPHKTFLIWNNRGGTSPRSDMMDCTITTKDTAGGNTGALVEQRWVRVRVDSLGESDFTAIGGVDTKVIGAATMPLGMISGAANDGNHNTEASKANYAKVTLFVDVPSTATAGNVNFLLRVTYKYE